MPSGSKPLSGPMLKQFHALCHRSCTEELSRVLMMTSSNGNIFRVTGHLCGEFTGPRWIPYKGLWRGALIFFLICVWINDWVNNREAGDLRRYRAHYDVIVVYRFTSQPREVPCHYPSTNEPTPSKKMPFLNYDMSICSEQNKKHRWLLILWAIYNASQCIGGIVLI